MSSQEFFLDTLRHVAGQPLAAAGYALEENPLHQARGLNRFHKQLAQHHNVFIEFQTLYNPQSELSYFRITLLKNSVTDARATSSERAERTLANLLWHEYDVRVLQSDDHWWVYKFPHDLATSLYDAGKLLFAYGVPWLEEQPI